MNGQQQEIRTPMGPGESFNLIYFVADAHATALTPFIRTGFGINANGWNGFGAMVMLILWWCGDPEDPLMSAYFFAWIGALLYQKALTLKLLKSGKRIHSRFGGDPWLALKIPFIRKDTTARSLEPLMCFVIGIALCPVSPALGALWIAGFLSLTVREVVDRVAIKARVQAMDDAEIEGRFYTHVRQNRDTEL